LCLESRKHAVYNIQADKKFQPKAVERPEGETMHLLDRADLPTSVPPCLTPPRRKRHALNTLKVVFSTAGDLIKVHSYGDYCSATWDVCLTYGRLESERGDGTGVAIRPEEQAWLDGIRILAAEWLAAVEANDRSWMARVATRIQRHDDRSDGLIDLVVMWPPDRRW
jgi:hypothetical protein